MSEIISGILTVAAGINPDLRDMGLDETIIEHNAQRIKTLARYPVWREDEFLFVRSERSLTITTAECFCNRTSTRAPAESGFCK